MKRSTLKEWFKQPKNIALMVVWGVLISVLVGVLAWDCAAHAQDVVCPPISIDVNGEAQQAWWMILLDFLLQLLTPIAIAVLTTLSSIALNKWGKKLDVDKKQALDSLLSVFITDGLLLAEEQGRKALKVNGEKTPGAAKLQNALDHVKNRLNENKLPEMLETELTQLIEAKLHSERVKPNGVIANDPS